MDLSWLKTIAPTVASALGGPLAGIAVEAIGSAFGWQDATKEKVEAALIKGQLTGEQIVALRTAEMALQDKEKDLGIRFAELEVQDRNGARDMLVATKSFMPAMLSTIVTVGYFGVLIGMMTKWLTVADSQALLIMLGSLGTAWGMVMAFWFGTTRQSEDKTRLLASKN